MTLTSARIPQSKLTFGLHLALALICSNVLPAQGGAKIVINSKLTCASCSIQQKHRATLDESKIAEPSDFVSRGASGRIYYIDEGLLKVFSSQGTFIRQVGRRGSGPGEYQMIRNVLEGGSGRIHVLDAALNRHLIFEESGKFSRSTQLPSVAPGGLGMSAVLLKDGQLLYNAAFLDRGSAGFTLQRVNEEGVSTGLFEETQFDHRRRWLLRRLLYVRSNGELLVADPRTFEIAVYDRNMLKRAVIMRAAEWTRSVDRESSPSDGIFDVPPTTYLYTIWEDDQENLWLYWLVPSPRWRPGPKLPKPGNPPALSADVLSRPRYMAILEVIDIKSQSVLARYSSDKLLGIPMGAGHFATIGENSAGLPTVSLTHFSLQR